MPQVIDGGTDGRDHDPDPRVGVGRVDEAEEKDGGEQHRDRLHVLRDVHLVLHLLARLGEGRGARGEG